MGRLRDAIPMDVRHRIARTARLRAPTGRFRAPPDVLVIGAQRAGTSCCTATSRASRRRGVGAEGGRVLHAPLPARRALVRAYSRSPCPGWVRGRCSRRHPTTCSTPPPPGRSRPCPARIVVRSAIPSSGPGRTTATWSGSATTPGSPTPWRRRTTGSQPTSAADDAAHDPRGRSVLLLVTRPLRELVERWFEHYPASRCCAVERRPVQRARGHATAGCWCSSASRQAAVVVPQRQCPPGVSGLGRLGGLGGLGGWPAGAGSASRRGPRTRRGAVTASYVDGDERLAEPSARSRPGEPAEH